MSKTIDLMMTKNLITIKTTDLIQDAYTKMKGRRIRHLPVINEYGQVIGILSDRDLQRAMIVKNPGMDEGVEFNPKHRVQDFMSWPVLTVAESAPVVQVAQQMLEEKISAFMVTNDSYVPKGIITTDDMLKLLIALLKKEPDKIRLSLGNIMESSADSYIS